jgi:hypothetical protein
MLQPTIYIPSRLTKLLVPLAVQQREVLQALADLLGPVEKDRPGRCCPALLRAGVAA